MIMLFSLILELSTLQFPQSFFKHLDITWYTYAGEHVK